MNVPGGIMHRINVGIFDPLKNMAALLKIEHRGLTVVFAYISKTIRFSQILTCGKGVQHDEIYLWSNFIALFRRFFAILNVISFKNLLV